jgi:hypothetical protein
MEQESGGQKEQLDTRRGLYGRLRQDTILRNIVILFGSCVFFTYGIGFAVWREFISAPVFFWLGVASAVAFWIALVIAALGKHLVPRREEVERSGEEATNGASGARLGDRRRLLGPGRPIVLIVLSGFSVLLVGFLAFIGAFVFYAHRLSSWRLF